MINTLQRYASVLAFLKPVVLLLVLLSLCFTGYTLVLPDNSSSDGYLMPAIVVFIWALTLYIMLAWFPAVPVTPLKDMRFFQRCKIRIKRFSYHLLSLIFIAASLLAIVTGYQLIKIWLMNT